MRGQMYDYYLDPNACLYGLHNGSAPVHIMFNPTDSTVKVVNNTFTKLHHLTVTVKLYQISGEEKPITTLFQDIDASSVADVINIRRELKAIAADHGAFLDLRLTDGKKNIVSDNIYWMADKYGQYSGLNELASSKVIVSAKQVAKGKIAITLSNPKQAPVAFFNRVALINPATQKRVMPVFYSDNYVSVLPGEKKTVILDYNLNIAKPKVAVRGWNLAEEMVDVK